MKAVFFVFYFLVCGSVVRTLKHSKIMEALRKPAPLSFEGNVAENWRTFESEFDIFVEAAYSDKNDCTRAYILLN